MVWAEWKNLCNGAKREKKLRSSGLKAVGQSEGSVQWYWSGMVRYLVDSVSNPAESVCSAG